jgi:hypothetical protein
MCRRHSPGSAARGSAWRNADGADIQCTALVVEELHANGFARVVYSVAVSSKTGNGMPYLFRVGARYVDGMLKFVLPTPARSPLTYRFDGAELAATFGATDSARLRRTTDIAEMRCAKASRAELRAPTGMRDQLTSRELMTSSSPDGPVHNDYR